LIAGVAGLATACEKPVDLTKAIQVQDVSGGWYDAGMVDGKNKLVPTVTSQLGYTGTEPRADMMKNSQFVDAKVQLFAKYSSAQWVKIGEYPVARTLLSK